MEEVDLHIKSLENILDRTTPEYLEETSFTELKHKLTQAHKIQKEISFIFSLNKREPYQTKLEASAWRYNVSSFSFFLNISLMESNSVHTKKPNILNIDEQLLEISNLSTKEQKIEAYANLIREVNELLKLERLDNDKNLRETAKDIITAIPFFSGDVKQLDGFLNTCELYHELVPDIMFVKLVCNLKLLTFE